MPIAAERDSMMGSDPVGSCCAYGAESGFEFEVLEGESVVCERELEEFFSDRV
jgi:hypothetical protein